MTSGDLPHAKASVNPSEPQALLVVILPAAFLLPHHPPLFAFCLCHQLMSGTQWWIHKRLGVLPGLSTVLVIVYMLAGLLGS